MNKALRLYERAAELGDKTAQGLLGDYYLNNKDNGNYKKAEFYLLKAAEQGDTGAMKRLASMYEPEANIYPDLEKTIKYYQMAAEKGEIRSQLLLGIKYLQEPGMIDKTKAKYWIEKARNQNNQEFSESIEQLWNDWELCKF